MTLVSVKVQHVRFRIEPGAVRPVEEDAPAEGEGAGGAAYREEGRWWMADVEAEAPAATNNHI